MSETRRQRFAFRLFVLRVRARRAWLARVAPYKLASEALYGVDGESPHFVRADLAKTPEEAAAYLARDAGMSVEEYGRGMDPIEDIALVWMVKRELCPRRDEEDGCPDDDCELGHHDDEVWFDVVRDKQRGAIRYWRWDW